MFDESHLIQTEYFDIEPLPLDEQLVEDCNYLLSMDENMEGLLGEDVFAKLEQTLEAHPAIAQAVQEDRDVVYLQSECDAQALSDIVAELLNIQID